MCAREFSTPGLILIVAEKLWCGGMWVGLEHCRKASVRAEKVMRKENNLHDSDCFSDQFLLISIIRRAFFFGFFSVLVAAVDVNFSIKQKKGTENCWDNVKNYFLIAESIKPPPLFLFSGNAFLMPTSNKSNRRAFG